MFAKSSGDLTVTCETKAVQIFSINWQQILDENSVESKQVNIISKDTNTKVKVGLQSTHH